MSRTSKSPYCVGSPAFQPDQAIEDQERLKSALDYLANDDLYSASKALLQLPEPDGYTYHAVTSVKLAEVQRVVGLGGINGLHTWYRSDDGSPVRKTSDLNMIVQKLRHRTRAERSAA